VRCLSLISAAVAVLGLVSCAGGGRPDVKACALPRASADAAVRAREESFVGMFSLPNTAVVLVRVAPLSLEPISRRVVIGEYHQAWSRSPDGSKVALGTGGQGIGVKIVDLEAMRVIGRVDTGIAAEELAWLSPRRLVAGLQRGGTVVIDPQSGSVLRRWRHAGSPTASVRIPEGVVTLHGVGTSGVRRTNPRLAVVDQRGERFRNATLRGIQLEVREEAGFIFTDYAGLAVDPQRARAYVVAADSPVAEVDLNTMRVTYHRLESLELPPNELAGKAYPSDAVLQRRRVGVWLGGGRLAVSGRDVVRGDSGKFTIVPGGLTLVDVGTWGECTLTGNSSGATLVGQRLLSYGPGRPVSAQGAGTESNGLTGFTLRGREAFQLFAGEPVWDVHATARRAYVRTRRGLRVVEPRSGQVLRAITPAPDLVDVISGDCEHVHACPDRRGRARLRRAPRVRVTHKRVGRGS
jgi:hypothetical protein